LYGPVQFRLDLANALAGTSEPIPRAFQKSNAETRLKVFTYSSSSITARFETEKLWSITKYSSFSGCMAALLESQKHWEKVIELGDNNQGLGYFVCRLKVCTNFEVESKEGNSE